MHSPNWLDVAAKGDLAPEALADEAAELRRDVVGDNLVRALCDAVEALERHDFHELAQRLGESFVQAFSRDGRPAHD